MYINKKNTLEHWNERFKGDWQEKNGCEQTRLWANLIFENLPKEIISKIKLNKLSISDVGCGLGEVCEVASAIFTESPIIGYDFSDIAINTATNKYNIANVSFLNSSLRDKSDVIILSNILEHTENPLEALVEFTELSNEYIVILVPYKEDPNNLCPEHCISISEDFFPDEFNGFEKTFDTVIDVRNSNLWAGDMELCVYEKVKPIIKEAKPKVSKSSSKPTDNKKGRVAK
jgi:SAM-dependent methyltransferase